MQTVDIRRQLHNFIDTIEDKKAEAIYTLLKDEIDTDEQRKKLILAERDKYLQGNDRSYNWKVVKEMALDKKKRRVL